MALKFLGRVGSEHYIDAAGANAVRPMQQFKGGTMTVIEDVPAIPAVPEIPADGDKPAVPAVPEVPATTRGVTLRVFEIGKAVAPKEGWNDEEAVMAKYPGAFEKVVP